MKRMLVIGGTGGIGEELVPLLNYDITSVGSNEINLPKIDYENNFDIVLNLAGVSQLNTLSRHSLTTKRLVNVNCLGAISILAHFLPYMREKRYGRIIFMSSVCADINLVGHGVYSASKVFIDKLVKIAAIENAEYGITVNSIRLGYTGLGMSNSGPENMARQIMKNAMKRFCTMKELAGTIDYIINTEYLTGEHIRLDGGIR